MYYNYDSYFMIAKVYNFVDLPVFHNNYDILCLHVLL